jgi:hypothetical protein
MRAITSNKWVLLLVLFLVLSNLALFIFAFSSAEPRKGRPEDWVKKELGLSDAQDKIFKESKEQFMNSMKPRWEEVNRIKDSLYRHLGDANVPDSVIDLYTGKWSEKARENDVILFRHFHEMRRQCTPEQYARYDSLVTRMVTRRFKK